MDNHLDIYDSICVASFFIEVVLVQLDRKLLIVWSFVWSTWHLCGLTRDALALAERCALQLHLRLSSSLPRLLCYVLRKSRSCTQTNQDERRSALGTPCARIRRKKSFKKGSQATSLNYS